MENRMKIKIANSISLKRKSTCKMDFTNAKKWREIKVKRNAPNKKWNKFIRMLCYLHRQRATTRKRRYTESVLEMHLLYRSSLCARTQINLFYLKQWCFSSTIPFLSIGKQHLSMGFVLSVPHRKKAKPACCFNCKSDSTVCAKRDKETVETKRKTKEHAGTEKKSLNQLNRMSI